MPEQISKYPEVTISVLEGVGAQCGVGAEQRILTKCPADRFCALPAGEICVYGITEIPQMTQITTKELARVVCPPTRPSSTVSASVSRADGALLGIALVVGLFLGRWSRKRPASPQAGRFG